MSQIKKRKEETNSLATEFQPQYLKARTIGTYLQHDADNEEAIKFEELIQSDQLQKAFCTTYQLDLPWLLSKLPSKKKNPDFNLCIVTQPNIDLKKSGQYQKEGCLIIVPELREITRGKFKWHQIMHAKLMLLFYNDFLRLIVSTGNLVQYDWTLIENTVFVQDIPLFDPKCTVGDNSNLSKLKKFMTVLKVPKSVLESLNRFDWAKANAWDLIVSIPGNHNQNNELGLNSLTKLIKTKYSLSDELYCLTSSLGALPKNFLNSFGVSDIRILFPTEEYITNSFLGPDGAGMICFNGDYERFPKDLLYQYKAKRVGSINHSKIILSLDRDGGWYYCGSHNFTKAAWGAIYNHLLTINNFEIGILMSYSKPTCYLPFDLPILAYSDEDKPWISKGHKDDCGVFDPKE